MRGATGIISSIFQFFAISIHAPHAGCDPCHTLRKFLASISIHAPHAGCDLRLRRRNYGDGHFNPRTPCGVRRMGSIALLTRSTFQSTHPMRGATSNFRRVCEFGNNFNPRTPCGVRHFLAAVFVRYDQFQSTHPMRGATKCRPVRPHYRGNFNPRTPCGVRLSYKEADIV